MQIIIYRKKCPKYLTTVRKDFPEIFLIFLKSRRSVLKVKKKKFWKNAKIRIKFMSHENWLTQHEKVWMAHETGWTQHEIWLIPHDYYSFYSELKLNRSKIIIVHATQNSSIFWEMNFIIHSFGV
jgi:hypothetical protein